MKELPLVAIVGRTNVGKSSLFNVIVGENTSLVRDEPGATRDRVFAVVNRFDVPFRVVDTGGLVGEEDENPFHGVVRDQALLAISEADLIICVMDGLSGPTQGDRDVVRLLRESEKPVLFAINKCEAENTRLSAAEFYGLGIDEFYCLSAAHRVDTKTLLRKIVSHLQEIVPDQQDAVDRAVDEEAPLRIAVFGKPNVGKSSLANLLCGEARVAISPTAGTTTEAIDIPLRRDGKDFMLVDTPGLRRKARVRDGSLEDDSNARTLRALTRCDVALLILDASSAEVVSEQDTKIAGLIHDRGIPCVLLLNKWDLVEKTHTTAREFRQKVRESLKFMPYAPILMGSVLTGKGVVRVLDKAVEIFDTSNIRIPTGELNRVIEGATTRKPPPMYRGRPLKIYFVTQVAVHPPTILLLTNHPKKFHFSYLRFLKNAIRKAYPYEGSEIRLLVRKKEGREEAAAS